MRKPLLLVDPSHPRQVTQLRRRPERSTDANAAISDFQLRPRAEDSSGSMERRKAGFASQSSCWWSGFHPCSFDSGERFLDQSFLILPEHPLPPSSEPSTARRQAPTPPGTMRRASNRAREAATACGSTQSSSTRPFSPTRQDATRTSSSDDQAVEHQRRYERPNGRRLERDFDSGGDAPNAPRTREHSRLPAKRWRTSTRQLLPTTSARDRRDLAESDQRQVRARRPPARARLHGHRSDHHAGTTLPRVLPQDHSPSGNGWRDPSRGGRARFRQGAVPWLAEQAASRGALR